MTFEIHFNDDWADISTIQYVSIWPCNDTKVGSHTWTSLVIFDRN